MSPTASPVREGYSQNAEQAQNHNRPVAETYEWGGALPWPEFSNEHCTGELRGLGLNLATLIYDGRNPGVGAAQQVTPGFQRARTHYLQVLVRRNGVSKPCVIADVNQKRRVR